MNTNKYTLDRFEGNYAIFLLRPQETKQLLIERNEISSTLAEGDIVEITDVGYGYKIKKLVDETTAAKQRVQSLVEKLRNKK